MNIESLSREDLEAQAELLGVKFRANASDETIRKAVKEALGEPVEDAPAASPRKIPENERITIIINKSETDKQPVTVIVNGHSYVMKRGEKVSVPVEVLEVLNHAQRDSWDSEMKESQSVMRFPYQVVR